PKVSDAGDSGSHRSHCRLRDRQCELWTILLEQMMSFDKRPIFEQGVKAAGVNEGSNSLPIDFAVDDRHHQPAPFTKLKRNWLRQFRRLELVGADKSDFVSFVINDGGEALDNLIANDAFQFALAIDGNCIREVVHSDNLIA